MAADRDKVTLGSIVDRLADGPDTLAVAQLEADRPRGWSRTELADLVTRLATGLRAQEVGTGETVALCSDNRPEWVVACLAVVRAGAIAVPLDPALPDAALCRQLVRAGCRCAFLGPRQAERLSSTLQEQDIAPVLLTDEDGEAGWRSFLAASPTELPDLACEATALLLFTSGTTGEPKGVPLSHANVSANLTALLTEQLVGARDRVLLPLPLHHAYPLVVGLFGGLASGSTVVFPASLAGPDIAAALQRSDATAMLGVPRLYEALLSAIDARIARLPTVRAAVVRRAWRCAVWSARHGRRDLARLLTTPLRRRLAPSLELLVSGGAALDPEAAWRLEGLGLEVLSGYGLTETAPILTFNSRRARRLQSAGRPIAGVELRIDPTADGELLAQGASVFSGYWDDPDATAAAFTEDGWFRTGDLGRFDGHGFLHITGRRKELIVLPGGEKVLPEGVELAIESDPAVQEAAVLDYEGKLVALLVPDLAALRAHGAVRAQDVLREAIAAANRELATHHRISGFAITRRELPRTPLGKLRRHLLPALYEAAVAGRDTSAQASSPETDPLVATGRGADLWAWLQQRFPEHRLTLDTSPQLDLGVDSLGWVGLSLELEERFRVRLSEAALARIVTVRDLITEALAAGPSAPERDSAPVMAGRARGWPLLALAWGLHLLDRLVLRLLFRLQIKGREHLPGQGAFVLTPNHVSYLDPLAVAAALPWWRMRRTRWAGWTGILFSSRARRLFSRAVGVLPVDPDREPRRAIDEALAALRQGDALVWFPEGQRSPDGTLQTFRPGIGRLLAESGVPAIPVLVTGTYRAWPVHRRLPRLSKVTVRFGAPVTPGHLETAGDQGARDVRITKGLQGLVAAMAAKGESPLKDD